jgi:hypothetical protein
MALSGKVITAQHRANISMALSGKVFTGRQVQVDEWIDNLSRAKTFIDTEGRMPSQRAGDAEERRRAHWIANNKKKERGTNSERDQLMKREIPLAFA